ncbi:hypothetical protein [Dyadobacter fanqingshengii]|uniref:ApeA N-terminal domain-containing protein n=1 Tax=Dyadobacter fanqingshengii TaxID=2906443 RepID=A0A9X1TAC9_9BACT|nr:hypothetical protein [Dyadobacter fanqingshengii]MCF0040819.1 hypothetical protein [Dyadobacter fanqingshengii]USJ37447.1 hypothetical protein NFI81_06620 [Dyadobacter fanqingshengii]
MKKESIEELRDRSEGFSLDATLAYIEELKTEKEYKIVSPYPTINGQLCRLVMDEEGLFTLWVKEMLSSPENPPVTYQYDGYGFHRPFLLLGREGFFKVPSGVGSLSMTFNASDSFNCKIVELESQLQASPHFFRCILPMGSAERHATYVESVSFNVGTTLHYRGLTKFRTRGIQINLFDYRLADGNNCWFVDTGDKCNYEDFKQIVEALIVHYGWIAGNLIRDTMTILFSDDRAFNHIKHHSFYRLSGSKRGLEAIRPRDMTDFVPKQDLEGERYLSTKTLTSLIELSLTNSAFYRACTILAESHEYPLEIRASTYSVVLETLKNIILEANSEKINSIKNRTDAKALIKDLKAVVAAVSPSKFNNLLAVNQRIEQLNQVGNTDSFYKVFELLGLSLSATDKECLKKRNDFLHGRLPFEDVRQEYLKSELATVVFRMHLLLCALLLKMGGFSGYLFNNIRYRFPELKNEPVYRKLDFGS